jgi:hypothetical protein
LEVEDHIKSIGVSPRNFSSIARGAGRSVISTIQKKFAVPTRKIGET